MTYTETRKVTVSEQAYEGTILETLLSGLTETQRALFRRGQEAVFTRTWKFGFDQAEEDRILKSESYSVNSRDEKVTRSVSRDVITDLLTYTHQEEIVDPVSRGELLGLGDLALLSDEPLYQSWSYAGAFGTSLQLLLEEKITLDIYGDGSLVVPGTPRWKTALRPVRSISRRRRKSLTTRSLMTGFTRSGIFFWA